MATKLTPHIERAIAYATACAFAHSPDGVVHLKSDIDRMLANDVPELEIVESLHQVPLTIMQCERIAGMLEAVFGFVPEPSDNANPPPASPLH